MGAGGAALLDVDRIERGLESERLGRRILLFRETASTNDIAWEYATRVEHECRSGPGYGSPVRGDCACPFHRCVHFRLRRWCILSRTWRIQSTSNAHSRYPTPTQITRRFPRVTPTPTRIGDSTSPTIPEDSMTRLTRFERRFIFLRLTRLTRSVMVALISP